MNCNILCSHGRLENFGLLRAMQGKGSFNIVRGQAKGLVLDLPVSCGGGGAGKQERRGETGVSSPKSVMYI